MRVSKLKVIFLLLFSFSLNIYGQSDSVSYNMEDIIDDYVKENADQNDPNPSIDLIESLINNPVDINKACIAELQAIPYVDLSIARTIIKQRDSFGPFFSKAELFFIKNIPSELIEKILPFIKVEIKSSVSNKTKANVYFSLPEKNYIRFYLKNRMTEDLQTRSGFSEHKFAGSPYHFYNKLGISYGNNLQAGALVDKDAGETSVTDFSSFYFDIKNFKPLDYFIIGDYQIQFGFGIAVGRSYGFSKGSEAIIPGAKKCYTAIPYTSSNENNFYRGITGSISFNRFNFAGFISKNKFDAKIDSINGSILSIPLDGLHRTLGELSAVDKSSEMLFGFSISYSYNNLITGGILFYHSNFSNPFTPASIYKKSGNNFDYYSFYYNIYFDNISLSGESAINGRSVSSFATIQIAANRDFIFTSSLRNYPYNYINLHGSGFGERSGSTNNEIGFYTGFKWRTFLGTINFYYDQFSFPYASYDNPLPSSGDEFLFGISSKLSNNIKFKFKIRREKKDFSEANVSQYCIMTGIKYLSKIELVYKVSSQLQLRGSFIYNNFSEPKTNKIEDGFLISQEINYTIFRKLNLITRLSFFSAASINAAIYDYENDMAGFLSGNIYIGEGSRWYIIFRYDISNYLDITLKYSETLKPNVKSLSSGYSTIEGNLDNRLGLQIEVKI